MGFYVGEFLHKEEMKLSLVNFNRIANPEYETGASSLGSDFLKSIGFDTAKVKFTDASKNNISASFPTDKFTAFGGSVEHIFHILNQVDLNKNTNFSGCLDSKKLRNLFIQNLERDRWKDHWQDKYPCELEIYGGSNPIANERKETDEPSGHAIIDLTLRIYVDKIQDDEAPKWSDSDAENKEEPVFIEVEGQKMILNHFNFYGRCPIPFRKFEKLKRIFQATNETIVFLDFWVLKEFFDISMSVDEAPKWSDSGAENKIIDINVKSIVPVMPLITVRKNAKFSLNEEQKETNKLFQKLDDIENSLASSRYTLQDNLGNIINRSKTADEDALTSLKYLLKWQISNLGKGLDLNMFMSGAILIALIVIIFLEIFF